MSSEDTQWGDVVPCPEAHCLTAGFVTGFKPLH